jgi:hypothetical protein
MHATRSLSNFSAIPTIHKSASSCVSRLGACHADLRVNVEENVNLRLIAEMAGVIDR